MTDTSPENNFLTSKSVSPQWNRGTKGVIALIMFAAAVLLLWFLREILPIIVVSALLAFLLNPLVTFLSRRFLSIGGRERRGCAVTLTFGFALVVVVVGVLVFVPVIINQFEEFARSLPSFLDRLEHELEQTLSQPLSFNNEPILIEGEEFIPLERLAEATGTKDLGEIIQVGDLDLLAAAETLATSVPSLSGTAFSFLGGAFTTIINLTFLLMMTFYLSKDGGNFVNRAISLAPDGYESDARRLAGDLGNVWNAYIRGQFILCVVMGFSVYFAALVLGVPNAPILGLLAGILEFVPNIGPFIALIPAAFLGLVSQSNTIEFLSGVPFMLVIIVVWTMLQNVEAVFLVPRIMGDSLNLHPFVVIVAILGGAVLAGPLGVILAAPMVASTRVLSIYIYGKLTDRPPFVQREGASRRRTRLERLVRRMILMIRRRNRRRPRTTSGAGEPDPAA